MNVPAPPGVHGLRPAVSKDKTHRCGPSPDIFHRFVPRHGACQYQETNVSQVYGILCMFLFMHT